MTADNSLTIFTNGARMLEQAVTIQQAKELKNLALTAKDWARRKGLGKQAEDHARRYALEAERKMGEMLLATKRAKGTDKGGRQYVDGRHRRPSNAPPTLSELGLTKNESAKAQRIAEIPQDKFDEVTSGAKTVTQAPGGGA